MKKIKNILVPTDFSDTASSAFRFALWFADHHQAEIELLHTVIPYVEAMDAPSIAVNIIQQRLETAQEIMKTFTEVNLTAVTTAHMLDSVPNVRSNLKIGSPTNLISQVAKEEEVDLIIMGTQGEHSVIDRAFGSVTNNTIGETECPVLVIPEGYITESIDSVAYATNLSKSDPYQIWEAAKIFQCFNPILRVVHIDTDSRTEDDIEVKDLKAFFEGNPPALQLTFHEIEGDKLSEELEDLVENMEVDLLVMYKPKRSLFQSLFHKSRTKFMTLHTRVPLLVLN